MDTPIDARAAGAARATRRARRRDGHGLDGGLAGDRGRGTVDRTATDVGRLDLREFITEAQLRALTSSELVEVLARIACDRLRLDAVETGIVGELRQRVGDGVRPTTAAPLLLAKEAARRLGVSVDYVRTHGEALGIAVPVGDLTRYDPTAVETVRAARQRRDLPRD
jgi:hypothetical protein